MIKNYKRVYIIAGHYGSGKTNIAVNLALKIKKDGYAVNIADLDIVNPYFRTKDSKAELDDAGIKLISPTYANTNVDLPALPQEVYALVQQKTAKAIFDVGGDDRGAYALGRYAPYILEENDYEMCFVVNFFRPLTRTAEDALVVMREIEVASGIKFTAIINNSNVGSATDKDGVLSTFNEVEKLSSLSGLPVILTTVTEDIKDDFDGLDVFSLKLQQKYYDIKE
jgi:hypothetical protein